MSMLLESTGRHRRVSLANFRYGQPSIRSLRLNGALIATSLTALRKLSKNAAVPLESPRLRTINRSVRLRLEGHNPKMHAKKGLSVLDLSGGAAARRQYASSTSHQIAECRSLANLPPTIPADDLETLAGPTPSPRRACSRLNEHQASQRVGEAVCAKNCKCELGVGST